MPANKQKYKQQITSTKYKHNITRSCTIASFHTSESKSNFQTYTEINKIRGKIV